MKTVRDFDGNGDRYAFDFKLCTAAKGYAQVDTRQDASYFGTWANPFNLKVVSFCEGDITIQTAETADEFVAELRRIHQWNIDQGYSFGIDGMCRENIIEKFGELGLADLLH